MDVPKEFEIANKEYEKYDDIQCENLGKTIDQEIDLLSQIMVRRLLMLTGTYQYDLYKFIVITSIMNLLVNLFVHKDDGETYTFSNGKLVPEDDGGINKKSIILQTGEELRTMYKQIGYWVENDCYIKNGRLVHLKKHPPSFKLIDEE
jgi:hypothetical protein